jgi:hypothetical protein
VRRHVLHLHQLVLLLRRLELVVERVEDDEGVRAGDCVEQEERDEENFRKDVEVAEAEGRDEGGEGEVELEVEADWLVLALKLERER